MLNLWARKGLRYVQIALLISFSVYFAKILSAAGIASMLKSQPLRTVNGENMIAKSNWFVGLELSRIHPDSNWYCLYGTQRL